MEVVLDIWNLVIMQPMINGLVVLYSVFFNNFGLSIIIFTLVVRFIMMPLTLKQSRQMKKMSGLQPKLKELQERHAKDRARLSQETMRMYKEYGVNPIGCLGPMVIQFPIWIGLYQAVLRTLSSTPESLVSLSQNLYSWLPRVHQAVPLDSSFLGMRLDLPDPTRILLPVLVGASMWAMQKMSTMPAMDPKQESTNRMMLWMMPLMFGFFTTSFPSGLALYWVISNVIGIVIQGFVTGWEPLTSIRFFRRAQEPATAPALVPSKEEAATNARNRDDSQDDRRSDRNRPQGARRRARRGRNRRR